jgi:hypothetical protein
MTNVSQNSSANGAMAVRVTPDSVIAMLKRREFIIGLMLVAFIAFIGRQLWPYYAPVDATAALRFFEAVALQSDDLYAADDTPGLRRWPTDEGIRELRVRVSAIGLEDRSELVMNHLSVVEPWVGMRFRLVGDGKSADIMFRYVRLEDLQGPASPQGLLCLTSARRRGGLLQGGLAITISQENEFCLDHEILHALGLPGHWKGKYARSALGTRWLNRSTNFTRWDEMALRTLYDRRLEPGVDGNEALGLAREIIGEFVSR